VPLEKTSKVDVNAANNGALIRRLGLGEERKAKKKRPNVCVNQAKRQL
jgi:hypothetical protein